MVSMLRSLAVLQRHFRLELVGRFVDEQDAERAVIDDAPGQDRDAAQQLVEVENRRHLARDLGQCFERGGVVALPLEQPRVGDGLRDVDAELREDVLVALREGARAIAQEVERADDAVLVAERHGQLPLDAGHEAPDTARRRATSLTSIGRCSATAVPTMPSPTFSRNVPDDFLRITFRVRDVQRLLLVVEEVDGEHGEVREARDQPRNAPQQLVEIENGRDFAPELE